MNWARDSITVWPTVGVAFFLPKTDFRYKFWVLLEMLLLGEVQQSAVFLSYIDNQINSLYCCLFI